MFFKLILISCLFLINTDAWVARGVYKNDAHPGKCYVNENLILSPGEVGKSPEGCSEIHCSDENGAAEIIGCVKVGSPENCRWDGLVDASAAYPICCLQKFVCDNPADEPSAQRLQNSLKQRFQNSFDRKQQH